jgi:hypothetical protein
VRHRADGANVPLAGILPGNGNVAELVDNNSRIAKCGVRQQAVEQGCFSRPRNPVTMTTGFSRTGDRSRRSARVALSTCGAQTSHFDTERARGEIKGGKFGRQAFRDGRVDDLIDRATAVADDEANLRHMLPIMLMATGMPACYEGVERLDSMRFTL